MPSKFINIWYNFGGTSHFINFFRLNVRDTNIYITEKRTSELIYDSHS